MKISVDVEVGRVRLGTLEVTGQWVDFYAILALARVDAPAGGGYVGADSFARIGPWRHKAPGSVGKEVSRHLTWLVRNRAAAAVEHRGRTLSWRLGVPGRSVALLPSARAVRTWLDGRSAATVDAGNWIGDLQRLVEATAALQLGDAESVLTRLEDPQTEPLEPILTAWSALLRGRAAYQHGDNALLGQVQRAWLKRADAPGKAVGARLRALVALRNRFEKASSELSSLGKLAAELELRGDVGSLASVVNVMGVLALRAGAPSVGAEHLLRAAGLFGIVGDYPSLQGALFNLAVCRRRSQEEGGAPPDETLLALVELCRLICERFGVGGDSAQAEITAADWAHEMGQPERARAYLAAAKVLVDRIDSTFDQAGFLLTRAVIEHDAPEGTSDPIHDLRVAARLFEEISDDASAARARRLLDRFTSEPRRDPRGDDTE